MSMPEDPVIQTAVHPAAIAPPTRSRPRIEWSDAKGDHSVLVVGRMLIGSSDGVGIQLNDPTVSRIHAELDAREEGVWIRDLGSRNGTIVDGLRVTGARLPPNARIRIGSTELRVSSMDRVSVEVWPSDHFGRLVGASIGMRELFAKLARVAPTDASVLVHGETGTGKELIAKAIHEASPRAGKPFVVVDCAALPENLLDAELFGHAKGAFTGAMNARAGAIEAAEGGTVFLDEIGELPIGMQPKLLRVLESRSVRRLGETSRRSVDVRFICATHRDLLTMVNVKTFREDLYFRLAVLPVTVPPLRDRRDDIERLVEHFWKSMGGVGAVSPDLMRELVSRPWRGNVRELRNFVERARALGATEALALTPAGGPPTLSSMAVAEEVGPPSSSSPPPSGARDVAMLSSTPPVPNEGQLFDLPYRDFREHWVDAGEREYVSRLLAKHSRNVAAAAKEAEVARTYVYRLMRKHAL